MASDVQDLREKIKRDIAEHFAAIEKLKFTDEYLAASFPPASPQIPVVLNGSPETEPESPNRGRFNGKMRHDACEMVLREIGRTMKTSEITEILQGAGYEPRADKNILQSSLFTAMSRKDGMFVKAGKGAWRLRGVANH